MDWKTSCLDWEKRIIAGESLITFPPLFPEEAERGLAVFKDDEGNIVLYFDKVPHLGKKKEVIEL